MSCLLPQPQLLFASKWWLMNASRDMQPGPHSVIALLGASAHSGRLDELQESSVCREPVKFEWVIQDERVNDVFAQTDVHRAGALLHREAGL